MRHGPWALRLVAPLLAVAATAAAQQEPKPKDLPDAPVPKQESAPQKRDNPFHATVEILGRRSTFFPNIATSAGPLGAKQKFELFADLSVAPSRFLSSAAGAGIGQAHNSLPGYGQEMGGYGKRFGSFLVSRTDDGRDGANWPGILGPLVAETLANSYLPVKEQTGGRTMQRYGIRIGLNTASNALREYWPTIFRSLRITKIAPGSNSNPGATPGATRPSP